MTNLTWPQNCIILYRIPSTLQQSELANRVLILLILKVLCQWLSAIPTSFCMSWLQQPTTAAGVQSKYQTQVLLAPLPERDAADPRFSCTSPDFPVHCSQIVHQNLHHTMHVFFNLPTSCNSSRSERILSSLQSSHNSRVFPLLTVSQTVNI